MNTRRRQLGFAPLVWLAAHQLIAASLLTWASLTAAGIDVADKAITLYDHVKAEQKKPE